MSELDDVAISGIPAMPTIIDSSVSEPVKKRGRPPKQPTESAKLTEEAKRLEAELKLKEAEEAARLAKKEEIAKIKKAIEDHMDQIISVQCLITMIPPSACYTDANMTEYSPIGQAMVPNTLLIESAAHAYISAKGNPALNSAMTMAANWAPWLWVGGFAVLALMHIMTLMGIRSQWTNQLKEFATPDENGKVDFNTVMAHMMKDIDFDKIISQNEAKDN